MILPHAATVVTPAVDADAYGTPNGALDYGAGASRREVAAFMQPVTAREDADGVFREAAVGAWVMFTRDTAITATDRVEYDGRVFNVTGVRPWRPPARASHHVEVDLREVVG